jgi:hypothetical protein
MVKSKNVPNFILASKKENAFKMQFAILPPSHHLSKNLPKLQHQAL